MVKIHASRSHPRYLSNFYRDLIVDGIKKGIVAEHGLIAHGRGETFDYLIGEKTQKFAIRSIKAAAALLKNAKYTVICVNGNTAVLVPKELIRLATILNCPLEINLFHKSRSREKKIAEYLKKFGAKNILLPDGSVIKTLDSNRRLISGSGQKKADVVFVPLEDGDRTEGLLKMGKKVITVDLNPLSRTAQKASITIVDNIIRALPLLLTEIKKNKKTKMIKYDNKKILKDALTHINIRLRKL